MVFRVRHRGLLLVIVWVLVMLTAFSALTFLEGTFYALPDSHVIVSVGWAGYVVSSSFNQRQDITAVSASWIVPEVDAMAGEGHSSTWIGIGGQEDKTLIQVGTEQDVVGDNVYYHAWYEMLPDYAIKIEGLTVEPGHHITATIRLFDSESNEWNIQLINDDNGQSFNRNFVYNSTRSSGEWVMERPTIGGQISTLAAFGAVTFTECTVTVGNQTGGISDFSYSVVHMTNQQYGRLATTLELNEDGRSFSVVYDSSS